MSMIWDTYGELWEYDDPVHFDGPNRIIIVQPQVSIVNMQDIYSSWVRWSVLYDNLKFKPAMRYIGNDPIGGGQYSGLMFFLQNGWQIVISHAVSVEGIIYHDDPGISPYIILPGGGVVNKVASLAYAYNTAGVQVPTANEIATAVWQNSLRTLTQQLTAEELWGFLLSTPMPIGSAGDKLKQVLTTAKFIGLK